MAFRLQGFENMAQQLLKGRGEAAARGFLQSNYRILEQERQQGMNQQAYEQVKAELDRISRKLASGLPRSGSTTKPGS